MKERKRLLNPYTGLVLAAGLVGMLLSLPGSWPADMARYPLFVLLAFFAQAGTLSLPGTSMRITRTYYVLGPAIYFFGAVPAAMLNVITYMCGAVLFRKTDTHRLVFNLGQFAFTTILAGKAFEAVRRAAGPDSVESLSLAVLACLVTYITLNHLLVNIYHLLRASGHRWVEGLKLDLIGYLIDVPLGILVAALTSMFGTTGLLSASLFVVTSLLLLRTLESMQRTKRDMQVFYENALRMSSHLEGPSVFTALVQSIRQAVSFEFIIVYLVSGAEGTVEPAYWLAPSDWHSEIARLQVGEGVVGSVIASVKPALVTEALDVHFYRAPDQPPFRSLVAAPLVISGHAIGAVLVASFMRAHFSPHDMGIISLLSEQAAISFRNATIYGQTREQAITDPMTGLYNYRHFLAKLHEEIERARLAGKELSLLYLDWDGLRQINNTYGHPTGDAALRELAGILRGLVRRADILARYAGDEFVLLMPCACHEDALATAARIDEALESREPTQEVPVERFNLSIGVASFPADALDADSLVREADKRMYEAKWRKKLEGTA
ncbi:MAG: sensor domain-containing diguanylate cyclase [Bacillota bacterium]|nr:sensor domain-containing diguanylate cyclase [Bacillota bacterium]